MKDPEFYVGYSTRAPGKLGHFTGMIAGIVVVLAIGLAFALSSNQNPFAPSQFEFGQYRTYVGVLISDPAPMLIDGQRAYLLSGPGKHGVSNVVRPMQGRRVELRGALAVNGPDALLEIATDGIHAGGTSNDPAREFLGDVSLSGEIVDSKCHFGVMNPGRGKVHRDCAVRCISGGIPPALLVRNAKGELRIVLLAGPDLARGVLPMVAEPVNVSGRMYRVADRTYLETDISSITRARRE